MPGNAADGRAMFAPSVLGASAGSLPLGRRQVTPTDSSAAESQPMGILDSLLSKAVHRATGVNAKRLIKKVGAGKILMVGGAALAGGLALDRMNQNKATGQAPQGAATPPLPPVPGATPSPEASAAEPSLPPLPTTTQPEPPEPLPGFEFQLVRTMVAAAWSDGTLDAEERALIQEQLEESSFSAQQVEQVNRELMMPVMPEELADGVAGPDEAKALLRAGILTVRADGVEDASEHVWLERLSDALGLDATERQAVVDDLDRALRLPPPPSANA